jgi:hypothetical protein
MSSTRGIIAKVRLSSARSAIFYDEREAGSSLRKGDAEYRKGKRNCFMMKEELDLLSGKETLSTERESAIVL